MQNLALGGIVCIALIMSLLTGIHALFRSQSYKRDYFLLMQAMIVIYLLGYLLELTSTSSEEAYAGVKVLYVGAFFVPVIAFFFLADYCNIKLHPVFIKAPMVICSLAAIITMWTTKYHHLVYAAYDLNTEIGRHLDFIPGPLFCVITAYPIVCMSLSVVVLLYQLKKWANKYRKQLLLFLFCLTIPLVAEGIHCITLMAGFSRSYIYLTPYAMAVMSFCLYLGVMRFSIFEIISMATETVMEHIREGFVLVDENNNYLASNPAATMILPGIIKLIKGESVFSARDWPEELKNMESDSVEFSINNEIPKFFRASISPVLAKNKNTIGRIILLREITDSVNLMKELENAAYLDALTGLYNRKHFLKLAFLEIERAIRADQSIYTAMLDLDFFKRVNDTYGHAAGDMVLKTTAGIIRQTIRAYDLIGRYGGEEFVLLITNLDISEAYKLMERIRENMENSITAYEGQEIKITCSIGLAKFIETDDLETSIKKADEALYVAKNSDRNQVQIYVSLPLAVSDI